MDQSHRCRLAIRGRRVAHLVRCSHGASTVEQALFIAIVIGAALAAIEGLGIVSHSAFFQVARGMHETSPGGASSNIPAAHAETTSAAAVAPASDDRLPSRFLLLLIACPFGAACWYLLYRESRQRAAAVEPAAPAAPMPPKIEQDSVFAKRQELLRTFSGDVGMLFTCRMRVSQIMTRSVLRVLPTAAIEEVRELMEEKKIRHVLVCDARGRLCGVISDRDAYQPGLALARDAMSSDPVTVDADCLVNPAVTLLLQKRISCLPVVDGQYVVGVVTTTDLLMALQCMMHALQRASADAVATLAPEAVPDFLLAALAQFDEPQPAESAQLAAT